MEVKEVLRESDIPARIQAIDFSILSATDIANAAGMEVTSRELYTMPLRTPAENGCLDARLGPIDKRAICATCNTNLADCPGHFGFVRLRLPVFHVGYFKAIYQICQMICKSCSRVLVVGPVRDAFLNRLRHKTTTATSHIRGANLRKVWDACKKVKICPFCRHINGPVRKLSALRMIHYPDGIKRASTSTGLELDEWDPTALGSTQGPVKRPRKTSTVKGGPTSVLETYKNAIKANPAVENFLTNIADDITPLRALQLFKKIPDEDVELLDMDPEVNRPEKLIMTALPIPPTCIRPSVCSDPAVGSTEDDLTMKLTEIIHINEIITQALDKGAAVALIMEDWEFLQIETARFINSEAPGLPPSATTAKPLRGIAQRLKGKTGRFRGNLSGKRVDFSGRTVISPDPDLRVDQVGVPERVARILTYPERVTIHSLARIQKLIINGPDIYPGANFVEFPDGNKRFLRYGNRERIARDVRPGCTIERHLVDGDIVLFNRQPSLHRISIMGHRIKVHPHRTFRFNECVCAPYNADFDGDEMNLHVPQTEEARTEAIELMSVTNNMITPRNGEPLVAATQDFLTCAFLLTSRDIFFDRGEFCRVTSFLSDGLDRVEVPSPAIVAPIKLWTGKQVFDVLFAGSVDDVADLSTFTVDCAGRNYVKNAKAFSAPQMCVNDGYISIRGGQLISGRLGKGALGNGSKSSILYLLGRKCGKEAATKAMNRLAKLSARWIGDCGFSIGIDDVTPSKTVREKRRALIDQGFRTCDNFIDQMRNDTLDPRPGCTKEQTLEALLNAELSKIREDAGKVCISELDIKTNSALVMAISGSKGSTINISQMVSCVGQQTVSGSRVPDGFHGRSLPHFEPGLNSRTPKAKGFAQNSFFSGLTGTEFFFHTMAGREGLVDTAVKTAETGYMQRRLMKALEDLSVQYDTTVRASDGTIVQFVYGDDGLDPCEMEGNDGEPVNLGRLFVDCTASDRPSFDSRLTAQELSRSIEDALSENSPYGIVPLSSGKFLETVRDFWGEVEKRQKNALIKVGLPADAEEADTELAGSIFRATAVRQGDIDDFFTALQKKMMSSCVEAGTAVGAIGAQSIGEPGTQMTLKTFHFAGVASMNITLGVPRIKEIINASKTISTPIITADLLIANDLAAARVVKNRVERTTLGEVVEYIREVYSRGHAYLVAKLDSKVIDGQILDVTVQSVCRSIVDAPKLKIEASEVTIVSATKVVIRPPAALKLSLFNKVEMLKKALPNVIVCGVPSIERAVINQRDDGTYNLLVEGINVTDVMCVPGLDGTKVTSNDIIAVEKSLGIEAARSTIMSEIQYTMHSHGMSIDSRHVTLLADVMSFRGEILGITRFGIVKMKTSTLMLASFEMTVDHLFDASVHSRRDDVVGVSECIIMGIPVPLGTGLFKLVRSETGDVSRPRQRTSLLGGVR